MGSGIFLSDALAAPWNGSQDRSCMLLEPWLMEVDIRLGQQVLGANTDCPNRLSFTQPRRQLQDKINPGTTCRGLNSLYAMLMHNEIRSF